MPYPLNIFVSSSTGQQRLIIVPKRPNTFSRTFCNFCILSGPTCGKWTRLHSHTPLHTQVYVDQLVDYNTEHISIHSMRIAAIPYLWSIVNYYYIIHSFLFLWFLFQKIIQQLYRKYHHTELGFQDSVKQNFQGHQWCALIRIKGDRNG